MPKKTGGWLAKFKDNGIIIKIQDTPYGFLVFPYRFSSGETQIAIAPITEKDNDMSWRSRQGPLTKSGKRLICLDLISVPTKTVNALVRAMEEMSGRLGGPEVQTKNMEKEIKIEQAKTNDDDLTRRLRILGLNK